MKLANYPIFHYAHKVMHGVQYCPCIGILSILHFTVFTLYLIMITLWLLFAVIPWFQCFTKMQYKTSRLLKRVLISGYSCHQLLELFYIHLALTHHLEKISNFWHHHLRLEYFVTRGQHLPNATLAWHPAFI